MYEIYVRSSTGGEGGEGKVTLLFSTFVSLSTSLTSVTSHSKGQELRVACANQQGIPQLLARARSRKS